MTTRPSALVLGVAMVMLIVSCSGGAAHKQEGLGAMAINDTLLNGQTNAPDFPAGIQWLNTDHPFSIKDFRGKLVLLDFWTFCCINCMHVIPELKKLEAKYPNELVVIGVHSAKFANEKGTEAIRQAILRYEIHHPVVNDKDFEVWQSYGARAWPTLVLINPNGKIIGGQSGEEAFDIFDPIISRAIPYFTARGELKPSPLKLTLESARTQKSELAFPGKVSADQKSRRLFITDSNHDRILVTDITGVILEVIGSGQSGRNDGGFAEARFNHPQGTYLDGDKLYIADTENHLVRVADLKTKQVKTILGTGQQARSYNTSGQGTKVALNSPWDVLVHDGKLYIAMAGAHQLWMADLTTYAAEPWAGSAREDIIDGPLADAALAQPSGMTTDGKKIYWADSETSSIRAASFTSNARVETLVGKGLFDFGDIDGPSSQARLQHPLGALYMNGKVYVADTYNSKIKIVDPTTKIVSTFAGTGKPGLQDGTLATAQFYEPGGLAAIDDQLFVADVNNQAIRVINTTTNQVGTLNVRAQTVASTTVEPAKMATAPAEPPKFSGRVITVPKKTLAEGNATIKVEVEVPRGYHLTDQAPSYLSWYSSDRKSVGFQRTFESYDPGTIRFPFDLAVKARPGMSELTLDAVVYFCENKSTVCMFDKFRITLPVEVNGTGAHTVTLSADVEAPGDRN